MKRILRSAAVAALFALSACGGSNSAAPALGPGSALPAGAGSSSDFTARLPQNSLGGIPCFSLSIALFDAPLTFSASDHINLAMLGVNLVGNDGVSHPMFMLPRPVVVDLLTLKKAAQLYQTKVAVGSYRAVEFIVVPAASSVVVGGITYPVRFGNGAVGSPIPLALDSPVNIVGTSNAKVSVDVDFNALESVSLANGVARIDPHFVVSTDESQVHGKVHNVGDKPVAGATILVADANGKVVNTSVTDKDGSFVVHALAAGAYTVAIRNAYTSSSGVSVTATGATSTTPRAAQAQLAAGVDLDLGTLAD
jgi:Carboxypeptidase regulatory-like domain/Domain of unknown function (DUF4382)